MILKTDDVAVDVINGRISVVVQSKNTQDDEQFNKGLDYWRKNTMSALRFVVFTDGGGPTAKQRKLQNEMIGGAELRMAVVTDSAVARFIISSIALFARRSVKGFNSSEFAAVPLFLGLEPGDTDALLQWIRDNANSLASFKVFSSVAKTVAQR